MKERGFTGNRFVVLWHQIDRENKFDRASHYDLMIESNDSLRTWAITRWPLMVGDSCEALSLVNHRLAYLDYEGPVSANRGCVSRVAAGTFRIIDQTEGALGALRLTLEMDDKELHIVLVDKQIMVVEQIIVVN